MVPIRSALGRITPGTAPQVTPFPQAGAALGQVLGSPQAISAGPDGTLWYADADGGLGEVSFCSQVLCGGELTVGTRSAELSGSLRQASSVGILVQRRANGRLVTVGRVPLGNHPTPRERSRSRWRLRVDGHRLPSGRYGITLRALNNHAEPIDKAVPVTITIR